MTALGLQPFHIYPAVIKLRHKGEQRSYDSPQKAEDFISSMSQQMSYAAALRGDDGGAAAAVSPARREGRASVLCRVCHVFPPLVSIFGLFPVLVSCHYELSMFQL